jgi:hypothetical protein
LIPQRPNPCNKDPRACINVQISKINDTALVDGDATYSVISGTRARQLETLG